MTVGVARALLSLAAQCLGTGRQGWALAMEAELGVAIEEGKPLAFAIGCLVAALREMIHQGEGRLAIANYVLALGLVLPIAALQFGQAVDLPLPYRALSYAMIIGAGENPYIVWSLNSTMPALIMLWLLLGAAHIRLAWVLVERDWAKVVRSGARIAAATTTIVLISGTLMNSLVSLLPQIAELGVELTALWAAAWCHARLLRHDATELATNSSVRAASSE